LILSYAVILGLLAGIVRARMTGTRLLVPEVSLVWLVLIAFTPQFIAFYFSPTRSLIPDHLVPYFLVSSQVLLLVFAAANLKNTGFSVMLIGAAANLLVILLNGGWMPISPETVDTLAPNAPAGSWQIGQRLGLGKDIVLAMDDTRLGFLSDRFLTPWWLPYQAAFSIGDVLIAGGAFWFMWSLGKPPSTQTQEST
jgi:hypothetical protein